MSASRKEGEDSHDPVPLVQDDQAVQKADEGAAKAVTIRDLDRPSGLWPSCRRRLGLRICGRRRVDTNPRMEGAGTSAASTSSTANDEAFKHRGPESVQEWAQGYGRFKYTGLRPDPLSPTAPQPQYSIYPVDLPLPDLAPSEKENLLEFSRRVADLTATGIRSELPVLLRFLRYKSGSVDAAEELFREAIQWRRENDVDKALSHWDLELYEEFVAPWWPTGGILGHGRDGRPVCLERLGSCDPGWLLGVFSQEIAQRVDIVHCMRFLGAIDEDCRRRKVPFEGVTLVIDLKNLGWHHLKLNVVRKLLKLFEGRKLLVAGCAHRILITNAPYVFFQAWSFLKNLLLYPETAALIQVADSSRSLELLRKYIDDAQIPECMGGKRVVNGDPECKQLLAPGGSPSAGDSTYVLHRLDCLKKRDPTLSDPAVA